MAKPEKAATEKIYEVWNESQSVINSGQIKIMKAGAKGDRVRIPESKLSEGLKRLLALSHSGLKFKIVE